VIEPKRIDESRRKIRLHPIAKFIECRARTTTKSSRSSGRSATRNHANAMTSKLVSESSAAVTCKLAGA